MKMHRSKKTLWLSLLSLVTLGIFILLAVGSSVWIPPSKTKPVGKGLSSGNVFYMEKLKESPPVNKMRKGDGWVPSRLCRPGSGGNLIYTEEAMMLYGMREGPCTTTYPNKKSETYIYHQDQKMPKYKTTQSSTADTSAFQILDTKYPWFLFSLDASGYDSVYVEAFMDTVEIMLEPYEFEDYRIRHLLRGCIGPVGGYPL